MSRDYKLYLDDILDSIDRIHRYIRGMGYDQFAADDKTMDAVVRNLEIIGEASKYLPEDWRENTAEIEWKKIIGLRNILSHAYFGINPLIIWDIIQNKLKPLEIACRNMRR